MGTLLVSAPLSVAVCAGPDADFAVLAVSFSIQVRARAIHLDFVLRPDRRHLLGQVPLARSAAQRTAVDPWILLLFSVAPLLCRLSVCCLMAEAEESQQVLLRREVRHSGKQQNNTEPTGSLTPI
jgi:hypothetical protein